MDWTVACICKVAGVRKEFNTEGTPTGSGKTPYTENAERKRLAEQVFVGGADDASGGFRGGLVAIAANQDDGKACRLGHQEAGGGGQLVGYGEHGGSQGLAVAIARTAQILEDGDAGRADGKICQAQAPGAAKRVADDDG